MQLKLQSGLMPLLLITTLKKITATKTSTLNFSPCAEEAEASSDGFILSNICKAKNKIPENKKNN